MDLTAYLDRIGYDKPVEPAENVLHDLHLAHLLRIPFSTIDALFYPVKPLSLETVEERLIRQRGGGYCLEHHLLFAEVLREIGFEVTTLLAKVHNGGPAARPTGIPRPHMILAVRLDGRNWLVDVTFGGGILWPVPIELGREFDQHGWKYRFVLKNGEYYLQTWRVGDWIDMYSFTLEPKAFTDLLMLNHFARTHPDSGLLSMFWAHRGDLDARWTFWAHWMHGPVRTVLIEYRLDGTMGEHEIDPTDSADVLRERFGMHLPDGARLPEKAPDKLAMARAALDGYGG
ncbi:N-hydroxyarylamine O-acetyltransferase [Lentzea sp. NBRC 105346]|uniref:arylamine N-acetyltransferase family protein n=1 Tax=Lentzea sp. NBRC 105346 TaxID=3032205 RepID=UPI0024A3FC4F|nr:arylamine N-acetyltransferase [Lentzea sp. NBRC 105346]GLZ28707.1 N-hydroxyarylamine O-acetyltransferase [Lentzea sp. NBRC 105346]